MWWKRVKKGRMELMLKRRGKSQGDEEGERRSGVVERGEARWEGPSLLW